MRTSRRHAALIAIAAAATLVLSACADPADDAQDGEPAGVEEEPGDAAAGGTTMRVLTVPEAREAAETGSIHVTGLLIDDGSGWRLCEIVLESYPPQCGGESLNVEGIDPAEYALEESDDVRWQTDATVVGEIDGDTLSVTGSPASS